MKTEVLEMTTEQNGTTPAENKTDEKKSEGVVGEIEEIIAEHKDIPGALIPVLDAVQERLGYLPEWALLKVAEGLDIPLSKAAGVASFYNFFHMKPQGRQKVQVCMGTACYVRGSQSVLNRLATELGVGPEGGTTEDGEYTLEAVRCVGACSLAPVVVIGEKVHAKVCPSKVAKLLEKK